MLLFILRKVLLMQRLQCQKIEQLKVADDDDDWDEDLDEDDEEDDFDDEE